MLTMNPLEKRLQFLGELERRSIYFSLARYRDAIMVRADVPGERWEIEFFADGRVEVEVFRSEGQMEGEEALARLLSDFSD